MIRVLLSVVYIITFSTTLAIWKEVQGFIIVRPNRYCLTSIISRKMSDGEQDRPSKKVKVEETIKKEEEDIKSESAIESTCLTNDKGESYFPIGDKRRCTIRKWKQNILIDIREVGLYYLYFIIIVDF